MSQSIHDFHDDPRNAGILIWVNGALKPRQEATVSVFDSGFVLGEARAMAFRNGFFDQAGALWNEAGLMLCSTHQTVYFKE